ncbi:hypothetical protein Tco_0571952, partial [Tanacetum coccineum]
MNYLEEQTDGEAMINSIQNGDHPLPVNDEGDEDLVLFNDVKYPLTDAEIKMFKERSTRSRAPTRQVA